jgi:hypothetical protein
MDVLAMEKSHIESDQNAREVRLNKALEEIQKYKTALKEVKTVDKGNNDEAKKQIEQLSNENKRLEKQRQELLYAFRKQLKLIDILKRQKVNNLFETLFN